jgi:hypothetical protein
MMNWKEFRSKRRWSYFKVLSRHLPGGIGKNYEKCQSASPYEELVSKTAQYVSYNNNGLTKDAE